MRQWRGGIARLGLILSLAGCGLSPNGNDGAYQPIACVDLAPNQTQLVNHSETSLPARYYLSRLADQNGRPVYHARIPVQFRTPHNTADSPLASQLLSRANDCLNVIAPMLNGPNGERLTIELAPPVSGEIGPFQIEIWTTPVRGHSQLWNASWQCPEITHEVFHLMGEVDEYRETQMNAYDCRELGPDDSLMSAPWSAFAAASPMIDFVQCQCGGPDGLACPAAVDPGGEPLSCPPGTVEHTVQRLAKWSADLRPATAQWASADPSHIRFLRTSAPGRPSLLFPAEFAMLISPGCQDSKPLVKTFYQCARDAYRSTGQGKGCVPDEPTECSNGATTWITGATAGESFSLGDFSPSQAMTPAAIPQPATVAPPAAAAVPTPPPPVSLDDN
jgi:hypothetical protein